MWHSPGSIRARRVTRELEQHYAEHSSSRSAARSAARRGPFGHRRDDAAREATDRAHENAVGAHPGRGNERRLHVQGHQRAAAPRRIRNRRLSDSATPLSTECSAATSDGSEALTLLGFPGAIHPERCQRRGAARRRAHGGCLGRCGHTRTCLKRRRQADPTADRRRHTCVRTRSRCRVRELPEERRPPCLTSSQLEPVPCSS